jgi:hypothetical protein
VEEALQEILLAYEAGHYRYNQTNRGLHKTIRQAELGSGMVLLFHAQGVGSEYSQFRVFADSIEIWLTINANRVGDRWVKDIEGASGGIRIERANIRFIHHYDSTDREFTDWPNEWRLPMSSTTNSAMEVYGEVQEIGRVGLCGTNTHSSGATIRMSGNVTFRNRFPAAPSSISFTHLDSSNFSTLPTATQPDRDGFSYYAYQSLNSNVSAWWYGKYTATV